MIALAWRNLWRQPRRTVLTVAVTGLACLATISVLGLQVGTYHHIESAVLGAFDGYAQVQAPGYLDDPDIRRTIDHPERLARAIGAVPGVGAVAVRAAAYALLSKGSRSAGVYMVGVEPAAEAGVSRLPGTVRRGRFLAEGDGPRAVVGAALARALAAAVGDRVTLIGLGRDGSVAADVLTVAGIFASGVPELDREIAEMPLARFRADFAMEDRANVIVVGGPSLSRVDAALPALSRIAAAHGLATRDWRALEPGLAQAIRLDATVSVLWHASMVVVAVAILLNTILMSVLERTREFGVLLAVGMRPGAAGRMVWLEILLLLLLGVATGIVAGAGVLSWFSRHGLAFPGSEGVFAPWGLSGEMYTELDALSLLAGPAAVAALTAAGGILPYLRVRRLKAVAAMRADR